MNPINRHGWPVPFDVRNTPFQRHVCIVYSQPGDQELRDRLAGAIAEAHMTVYEDDDNIPPNENISRGINCSLKSLILVTKNFVRDGPWTEVIRLAEDYAKSISADVVVVARAPDVTQHDLQSLGLAEFQAVELNSDSYSELVSLVAGRPYLPPDVRPNMGWTMAVCYYHGYLSIILPGLNERVREAGFTPERTMLQNLNGRNMSHKLFIIIPRSLKCQPRLSDLDPTITDCGKVKYKASRGGLPARDYSSYVHKIHYKDGKTPKKYMFLGEVPAVLISIFDMSECTFSCNVEPRIRDREVQQFYLYLLSFLENNPECQGKYRFIFHQDESLQNFQPIGDVIRGSVEDEIWNEMKEGACHNDERPDLDDLPMEVDAGGIRETVRPEESVIKAQYLSEPEKFYGWTLGKDNERGRALIINNRDFECTRLSKRRGAEKDEEKMYHLLRDLNFAVDVRRDQTAEDMRVAIRQYAADQNHCTACAAVCVIMTHGQSGQLYGTDGEQVSIVDLLETIGQSEYLRDKPKLVFIEACQAAETSGDVGADSVLIEESDIESRLTPKAADLLVSFSTLPGRRAYRSPVTGTLYVQELVSVIRRYRRGKTLEQMLHMVAERVQQAAEADLPSTRGNIVPRQRPFYISILTKSIVLQ